MPLTTRGGTEWANGASTQGRAGNRSMRKPNRRTLARRETRQSVRRLPRETTQSLPPTTPPEQVEVPRTRNKGEKVTCSHFGMFRRDTYPGYFFCQKCVFFDTDSNDPTIKNIIKRHSQTYRCQARHKSWAHPSHRFVPNNNTLWYTSRRRITKRKRSLNDEYKSDVSVATSSEDDVSEDEESLDDSINEKRNEEEELIHQLRIRADKMIE